MRWPIPHLAALLLAAPAVFAAPSAQARESEADWELCGRHTARTEVRADIPRHLLTAISLVESGRWNEDKEATLAWPWTINAAGKGYFLPSKQAAIAKVRALRAEGIRSVDVGCMQINLHHHADAFDSLEEAFDPATNVAYASRFLGNLRESTGSWTKAAAHYHSANSEHGDPYKLKVVRTWHEVTRSGGPRIEEEITAADPGAPDRRREIASRQGIVDHDWTRRLNASLRERRQEGTDTSPAGRLAAWRGERAGLDFSVVAAMQRAEIERRQRDKVRPPTAGQRSDAFAEKRRDQLDYWRTHILQR